MTVTLDNDRRVLDGLYLQKSQRARWTRVPFAAALLKAAPYLIATTTPIAPDGLFYGSPDFNFLD